MTGKTPSNKLPGPKRDFEVPFNSGALPGCPEMSVNVRSSEISGPSGKQTV